MWIAFHFGQYSIYKYFLCMNVCGVCVRLGYGLSANGIGWMQPLFVQFQSTVTNAFISTVGEMLFFVSFWMPEVDCTVSQWQELHNTKNKHIHSRWFGFCSFFVILPFESLCSSHFMYAISNYVLVSIWVQHASCACDPVAVVSCDYVVLFVAILVRWLECVVVQGVNAIGSDFWLLVVVVAVLVHFHPAFAWL